MKYNQLNISRAKNPKRVGRGIAAGQGKTAGRGTKGQKARTGYSMKPGFEGGQNPLMQRLPKLRGFRSHRTPAETIYTGQLEMLSGATVTTLSLAEAGLITNPYVNVKLLVKGTVAAKKTVEVQSASKAAIAQLEAAGGKFAKVAQLPRPKKAETEVPASA